ncbi:MAG TPA: M50 family metallopeptidase [Candidatus Limnocylindrales bacterium]|nr:M50 family metallopeptidase [Candidatus Limnocylindrales bacterium]
MPALDALLNIAIVLAILVALVVVHEFGHFLVAKRAGVLVHEFGIGFPPRAAILHRGQETLFTLNWLPLGGFVRLEGEDGDSADPRSFSRQPMRIQTTILVAGVAMNLLAAWLIFALVAGLDDPTVTIPVDYVFPDTPAAQVGLVGARDSADQGAQVVRSGDVIVGYDGQRFAYFDALQNDPLEYPGEHAGQRIVLDVRHADGNVEHIPVQLRGPEAAANGQPTLGIVARSRGIGDALQRNPVDAAATGLRRTVQASGLILGALRDLVTNITQPQVSGPIGIVSAVGTVRSEAPPIFLVYLVGLLSANLAIVNILPFPPLDGGRIVMGWIKAVVHGRLSVDAERATYLVGFALLLAFIVYISFFDLQRLGGGG